MEASRQGCRTGRVLTVGATNYKTKKNKKKRQQNESATIFQLSDSQLAFEVSAKSVKLRHQINWNRTRLAHYGVGVCARSEA
jgi:hypothetical protein